MWLEILLQADIIDWEGLLVQVEEWIRMEGGSFVSRAFGAAGSVVGSIATGFIGLIFSIYILSQKETLKRQACRLIRAWLPKTIGETIIHIAAVCSRIFRLFIAGQATEAVILGTLCMLGMMLLGLPYAPMIGALVGTTALIPIVGAFVGTIVGAVMIVTVNPVQALVFVAFLLILQQVEGNMIYPRVVGSKLNLPAIWVLAAITVGGNIAGPLGMLFGVPLVSSAYTLIREATEYREARQNRTEHKKT